MVLKLTCNGLVLHCKKRSSRWHREVTPGGLDGALPQRGETWGGTLFLHKTSTLAFEIVHLSLFWRWLVQSLC